MTGGVTKRHQYVLKTVGFVLVSKAGQYYLQFTHREKLKYTFVNSLKPQRCTFEAS